MVVDAAIRSPHAVVWRAATRSSSGSDRRRVRCESMEVTELTAGSMHAPASLSARPGSDTS